jgi:hypothetical protein
MRAAGKITDLEVVSLSEEEGLRGARIAVGQPAKPAALDFERSFLFYFLFVLVGAIHYEYTSKGNLAARSQTVRQFLGLDDRGALAGKPVMEGGNKNSLLPQISLRKRGRVLLLGRPHPVFPS